MRTISIKWFYLIAVATLSLSCANNVCKIGTYGDEINESQIGVEPRIVKGVAKRVIEIESRSDSSEFIINYSYFSRQNSSYTMDSVYKDSVNFLVYQHAIYNRSGLNRETNREPLTKSFFTAQLDSLATEFYYDVEGDEHANLWDLEMNIGIQDYPSFVELNMSGWGYLGGAHGYYYDEYVMINREDGRKLGVADFFTSKEDLNAIAEVLFRKQMNMSTTDNFSESDFWFPDDKFSVNENFTLREEGVMFYYNVYEIAPYVMGPTELLIPMDKIKHLLKLEF